MGLDDPSRPRVDGGLLACGAWRSGGRQRDRQLLPCEAFDRSLFDDHAVLELLDHGDPMIGVDPSRGSVEREGRGQFVDREGIRAGAQSRAGSELTPHLDDASIGSGTLGPVPVLTDARTRRIHRDDVSRVFPERHRLTKPQIVSGPERLRLTRVIVDRGGGQAQRLRVGSIGRLAGKAQQSRRLRRGFIAGFARFRIRCRAPTRLAGAVHEPVTQAPGRDAVVAVVVGDVIEDELCGIRVTVFGERPRLDVTHDRVIAALHVTRADLVAHVERLELLDRIGPRPYPQGAPDHGVKVNEDAVAQQAVDLRLTHAVPRGHLQQVGGLIGRVVVDVHPRVGPPAYRDHVEKGLEGSALVGKGVGPQRVVLFAVIDPAE